MNNIEENLLKYSGKEIIVVIDDNKNPWFNSVQILKYSNTGRTLYQLIDKDYIRQLKNILPNFDILKNAQPNSLFVNEFGLYAFLLRSKRQEAKHFFKWIVETVIPNIRQKGYYELDIKKDTKNEKIKETIDKLYQKNFILKNNKNKNIGHRKKYIYVVKTLESINKLSIDKNDVLKIGKTKKYKNGLATHIPSHKDDIFVLYRVEVDDNDVVEQCLKALLKKQKINNKEFFNISLKDVIKNIIGQILSKIY